MVDKNLRNLERLQDQDPIRLKLLQRRLGQGVYVQEAPRPIKVFNSTELLIDISKVNKDKYGLGVGSGSGNEYGDGTGSGSGDGAGFWLGHGYGSGYGHELVYGYGSGLGWGDKKGKSEDSYTRKLREKHNG